MEDMSQTTVVVTGGAGFIGSHVVDALVARGCRVRVVDVFANGTRDHLHSAAELYEVDICDVSGMTQVCAGADVVFHLAAIPSVPYSIEHPRKTHDVNVTGTVTVLEAARQAGVRRVVFSSSAAVYGNEGTLPIAEDVPTVPNTPYGLHKLIGEQYCRFYAQQYGVQTVSLRYFNVFGARQDPAGPYAGVIGVFIRQLQEGKQLTIAGDGTQTRDFVDVRDVARANVEAAFSEGVGNGEAINIGSGISHSVNDIAYLFSNGPYAYMPERTEIKHSQADIRQAATLLAWEPSIAFEEGIKELKTQWGLR